MSTFDGIVDEFPNIRIDYFRSRPDRVPPQACFLSHVHSDHLQGLETLKMPFVYCSAATKSILLRMEKYPHRINFAKGILEARKQTYKSLKLVLRALPLETPVGIELGPKSRIRVTLFDANHCPGSVMFLIEGLNKAVLYTGDVRAEPWWVNSIVRNPLLLPYSCGAKRLDCIYLDTTFASHNDVYAHFPTKAEGLKELLTKVSKCPKTSTFYFRSWTLGYEDVWIALSNFLQSRVHVDAYQLRIFRSLAEDVNTSNRGPALAGFDFGNQHQLGCLTDDPAESIHSCEPGTECHDTIRKQNNVVWITPIISRLKDGTEVAEMGAGGGGGDLYQTPELESIDEATLQTLEKAFAESPKYKEALTRLGEAFVTARAKGNSSILLEGLGLEQDEEVSLKTFLQLISRRDESVDKQLERSKERIIHFPYSRHSSFSELRYLISSFQPKDICPCTVDIDAWSEEVSIETLFGDLCSEKTFRYDQHNRSIVEENQARRGVKRKRGAEEEDSQRTKTQQSLDIGDVYVSAETSLRNQHEDGSDDRHLQRQSTAEDPGTNIPVSIQQLHRTLSDRFNDILHDSVQNSKEVADATLDRINQVVSSHQEGLDDEKNNNSTTSPISVSSDDHESDISLPTSAFHSQPEDPNSQYRPHNNPKPRSKRKAKTTAIERPQLDGHQDTANNNPAPNQDQDQDDNHFTRITIRKTAYRAAKSILLHNDHDAWQDLRLRSLGWEGHTAEEVVL